MCPTKRLIWLILVSNFDAAQLELLKSITDFTVSPNVYFSVYCVAGMGPMPWTINSEIYPLWARSTGNSVSTFTNWTCNLAVSMSFISLTEALTRYGLHNCCCFFLTHSCLGLMPLVCIILIYNSMCFFHRNKGSAKGNEMEAKDISKAKSPRIVFWYF